MSPSALNQTLESTPRERGIPSSHDTYSALPLELTGEHLAQIHAQNTFHWIHAALVRTLSSVVNPLIYIVSIL